MESDFLTGVVDVESGRRVGEGREGALACSAPFPFLLPAPSLREEDLFAFLVVDSE